MLVETARVPDPNDACQTSGEHNDSENDLDADLIARIACEDRQALTDLYEKRRPHLLYYVLGFTADHSLAEEILQDIFLAVWKNAHSYQGAARGRVWLWGIARTQAWKTLRRHKALDAALDDLEALPAPDLEPEAALFAQVERDELIAALERVAPAHREVLLLRKSYDFSYQDIASVQQVPIGTVRSRISSRQFLSPRLHCLIASGPRSTRRRLAPLCSWAPLNARRADCGG
jgi:RNA polymerase sigma-70 factor (ECF subfamily)